MLRTIKVTSSVIQKRSFFTVQVLNGSRYYNPRIALNQTKNVVRNMDRLVRQEVRKRDKEEGRKESPNNPKNPVLYDTNKTRLFNRQFMENIGSVMAAIPELVGRGISITKVNVTANFADVRVFWVSSVTEPAAVEALLMENISRIRKDMYEVSGLGKLPRIVFVLDINYLHMQKMDQLFQTLELQPGYMEHKDPEVSVWSLAADSLVLNVDGGGLNRDQIMSKVAQEAEKSRALHRQTATAAEFNEREFEIAYRDSINRDGFEQKQEIKQNIRKFLSSRKKQHKRSNVNEPDL